MTSVLESGSLEPPVWRVLMSAWWKEDSFSDAPACMTPLWQQKDSCTKRLLLQGNCLDLHPVATLFTQIVGKWKGNATCRAVKVIFRENVPLPNKIPLHRQSSSLIEWYPSSTFHQSEPMLVNWFGYNLHSKSFNHKRQTFSLSLKSTLKIIFSSCHSDSV